MPSTCWKATKVAKNLAAYGVWRCEPVLIVGRYKQEAWGRDFRHNAGDPDAMKKAWWFSDRSGQTTRKPAQHLNQEAAKDHQVHTCGGMTPEQGHQDEIHDQSGLAAGIDDKQVGSIEVGEDADFRNCAITIRSSVYAVVQKTIIDGKVHFDRRQGHRDARRSLARKTDADRIRNARLRVLDEADRAEAADPVEKAALVGSGEDQPP